jgi:hypothetical protein
MKMRTIFSLSFIVLALSCKDGAINQDQAKTIINYTEDSSNFSNPERGLYHEWLSSSDSPSALQQVQFDKMNVDKMTLIRRLYSMTTFRSGPISNSFLEHIQTDMDNVRTNGVKVILRFSYTNNEPAPWNDASLTTVLSHIDQLAPILKNNADVIAYLEAGFIGRWGEWHTSSNHLDNVSDMKAILLKILGVLPTSRAVAVRYQQYKKDIYDNTQALSPGEGFNESNRARTAHHNDCFVADVDDWGTYWPIDEPTLNAQKNYLNAENRFLPQGGETCNLNPPRSDCAQSVADLIRMRWSTLNDDYHGDVLNSWKSQNCYDDIRKKLGYRFRLVQATIPLVAKIDSVLVFNLSIRNDGYATPYNTRDLEIVFRAKANGTITRFKLNDDPRKWLPENGDITIHASISFPSNFPLGDYEMMLNLPDPAAALNTKPAYSIRLANMDVWEPATGYNSLMRTITISQP